LKHNYISTGFDGNKYISAILTESCRQVRGARKQIWNTSRSFAPNIIPDS